MVYENKLIAVIKHNNNILREDKDLVYLPFDSEYSILFKNKNISRCAVNIEIDGKDVLSNNKIIIPSNSEEEVDGFMDNTGVIKNKFKFIKKTEQISNYRGDRIDDGIINIQFQFEKIIPFDYNYNIKYYGNNTNNSGYYEVKNTPHRNIAGDMLLRSSTCCANLNHVDEGITVKGTPIDIKTTRTSINLFPEKYNIIIRLKGNSNNSNIEKPIYNNTKLICETCGSKNKSRNKFCYNCGTSLI